MNTEQLPKRRPFDAAVIGGGPAGSAAAFYLRRSGYDVCLVEKKSFPRETVCGEFLSNEVSRSLNELGIFHEFLKQGPNLITSVRLHAQRGQAAKAELGFIAYGMKRGSFDRLLLTEAAKNGVCVIQPAEVDEIVRCGSEFTLRYHDASGAGEIAARRVIAAYGKQNILDKRLRRPFIGNRSHLNGIKFHIDRQHCPGIAPNSIHLFTGPRIYCGVNAVDDGKVTVCFLEERSAGAGSAQERLEQLAAENAAFRNCFDGAIGELCAEAPLHGAGNIFFGAKEAVCRGVFMTGDAAAMIAPLTGDGIGMAFEGARLLAAVFDAQRARSLDANAVEALYRRKRHELFSRRLRVARAFQSILLSPTLSAAGLSVAQAFPRLLPRFIAVTRG